MDRRQFMAGIGTIATVLPLGRAKADAAANRLLWLYNSNTREEIRAQYVVGGSYRPTELRRLDLLMRDWRRNMYVPMDRRIFDILYVISLYSRTNRPIHVNSGYRTLETNAELARSHEGVAVNSFHLYGRAADIVVEGFDVRALRDLALSLGVGGVGYYPSKADGHGFVHVDTGPPREWQF